MARKNIIEKKLLSGVSLGESFVSNPVQVGQCDHATVHAKWSGTPNGELTVEVNCLSDDETTWYAIDISSQVLLTGSPGEKEFIIGLDHARLRVRYVASSGDGSISAEVHAKSIGA